MDILNSLGFIVEIAPKYWPSWAIWTIIILFLIFIIIKNILDSRSINYIIWYFIKKSKQNKEVNDIPNYIKNFDKDKKESIEFYKRFKVKGNQKFMDAVKSIYDSDKRNLTIVEFKKCLNYCSVIDNNGKNELDINQYIALPTLYLYFFSAVIGIFIMKIGLIVNAYYYRILSLYKEKENISQILPYYNIYLKHNNLLVWIYLALLLVSIILIVFSLKMFEVRREMNVFKKYLDQHYERSDELSKKKLKKYSLLTWVFLIMYIVFVGIFAFFTFRFNPNPHLTKPTINLSSPNDNEKGVIYYNGGYALKNYKKAIKYWRKAVIKKDPYGQLNLGYVYAKGIGIARNPVKAKTFIQEAFCNPKANKSIRLLAVNVWDTFKLWQYNNQINNNSIKSCILK